MFARERAAIFEDQVRDVVRDRFELADAFGGLHVDDGTDMQATNGGVGVNAGGGAVAAEQVQEAADELAEFLGRDGGVFDEGDRLGVLLDGHREAERSFAQAPDSGLLLGVSVGVVTIAEGSCCKVRFERLEARRRGLPCDRRRTPRRVLRRGRPR